MLSDWEFILAVTSCVISIGCFVAIRKQSSAVTSHLSEMGRDVSAHAIENESAIETLKLQLETLHTSVQDTDRILREGRLNRSTRSQAFEMLRSGVGPDTAAAKLGIARREAKLLARVSQVLSAWK